MNRTNSPLITINMVGRQTDTDTVFPAQVQMYEKKGFSGPYLFGAVTCFHKEAFLYRMSCYVQRLRNWVPTRSS